MNDHPQQTENTSNNTDQNLQPIDHTLSRVINQRSTSSGGESEINIVDENSDWKRSSSVATPPMGMKQEVDSFGVAENVASCDDLSLVSENDEQHDANKSCNHFESKQPISNLSHTRNAQSLKNLKLSSDSDRLTDQMPTSQEVPQITTNTVDPVNIKPPANPTFDDKRRNTITLIPTHFVHKRGSQELPELIPPINPYTRKIATLANLKNAVLNSSNSHLTRSQDKANASPSTNTSEKDSSTSNSNGSPNAGNEKNLVSPSSPSMDVYRMALENDDFSQIDFGLEVNSAQTSASEITFPVPKGQATENRANAFYGNATIQNNNYYFGYNAPNTLSNGSFRKNSVIEDDSMSDVGSPSLTDIANHYELYIICVGDLDTCLVNRMLKTAGGPMYHVNRQVSFILRNTSEKVTFSFNFYSQFNWYLMDFLKDEAKDCHGFLFMFNITNEDSWNELSQTITKKYISVPDFVRPSLVLGTYSHSDRKPSVVDTSQVISSTDKWKEKQVITYLEIDVEDKDECKMALTHLATSIIQNMKSKKENTSNRSRLRPSINWPFSKICGSGSSTQD